ncbi:uroporphyrinogen-III synthase [Halobacillus sp. A1]|uniref:uroporphyrinogen-III synthase n=1 Tax=Halobacillus sp. A1 TaxID=2880262 RepID=UPI0020A6272A|nr:uroporphyrinogen-III synthase [Halobacillus sp. A1]MCP3030019.1 uroporphyrinogen-III synthase [Halobacillus sp. A1]
MQAVLYVSHGTRYERGKQEAIDFLKSIQSYVNAPLQEICFLEIVSPNIEEGIHELVNKGATSVAVIPVLLLKAGHALSDIPIELEKVQKKYPQLTLTYGEPLGVQERIIDAVEERVREVKEPVDAHTKLLLVGRGSYDPATKRDIGAVGDGLKKRLGIEDVDIAYLAAAKPSFNEAIEKMDNSTSVVVVPYLWFDGLLIQSMKEKVQFYNQNGGQASLCHHLNDHEIMKKAMIDRVHEAFDTPFTGVKPLAGKKIAVAAERNSEAMEEIIRKQNGRPIIRSIQGEKWLHEKEAEVDVQRLIDSSFDWVILTTGIGARALEEASIRIGRQQQYLNKLQQTKLAIRGSKTVKWLKEKGLEPDLLSDDGTMDELIQQLKHEEIKGHRIFLQQYNKDEKELLENLQALPIELYQSLPYHYISPDKEVLEDLRKLIVSHKLDAVLFTSKTQVQNLFAYAGEELIEPFHHHVLPVAVGQVTADELRHNGVSYLIEPDTPKMGAMIVALTNYYKEQALV